MRGSWQGVGYCQEVNCGGESEWRVVRNPKTLNSTRGRRNAALDDPLLLSRGLIASHFVMSLRTKTVHFGMLDLISYRTALVAVAVCACSPHPTTSRTAAEPNAVAAPTSSAGDWPSEAECEVIEGQVADSAPEITAELVSKLQSACPSVGCACHPAAAAYRDGVSVVADPRKAVDLFETGCRFEDWSSCNEAAFLYEGKSGVPADHAKMIKYWELSCEHEAWFCQNLAFVYVEGTGAPVDYAKAEALMRRSCDVLPSACMSLANFLKTRAGKPAEAERFFERACREDASFCDRNRQPQ